MRKIIKRRKNKTILIYLSLLLIGFSACRSKNDRIGYNLMGDWNISSYQFSEIYNDGSVKVINDYKQAGTWHFEQGKIIDKSTDWIFQDGFILDYTYTFTATQPQEVETGTIFISDEGLRLIFIGYWCEHPEDKIIGCDMMYNIQSRSKNRIVIEQFRHKDFKPKIDLSTLVPAGDPNSEAIVYKTRMVLEKK